MKKIKYFLHKWDGVWSFPISLLIFIAIGFAFTYFFGFAVGTYDVGLVQAFFLAVVIAVGCVNFGVLGLRFNLYTLYKYIFGKKKDTGRVINVSKDDWRKITSLQRLIISGLAAMFFILLILIIFLKLI